MQNGATNFGHSAFPVFDEKIAAKMPTYRHMTKEDRRHVYLPSDDTFLLLDAIHSDFKYTFTLDIRRIVEVGTGSGVVATSLAILFPDADVTAVDINPFALDFARRTAKENNTTVSVISSDLLANIPGPIDMLVFNPPYVPDPFDLSQELTEDNALDFALVGGPQGRSVIDRFIPEAAQALSEHGTLYLIAIEANGVDELCHMMEGHGFDAVVMVRREFDVETLVIIRAVLKPAE
ncbi:Eukaryotic/archaeal PrmC-related [Carpediemonas membranifera]|uniref:Eukaryotic/archaeal PrmC-related n=1 Tax=Carpediemonas membranifera TaxID=201153 RepID=A0A8J6AYB4_9EUKA|nr:Eukaryotic/archaeal PrmC-related [Carpediemonas membranifera]|eukprot:KAG9395420.1 Eukaryotic/archaeal PrmC-related [Carpediemonas membranifera]